MVERTSKYDCKCPICSMWPAEPVKVTLRDMFSHLFTEHHFNMGHPDNLVFVPELLDRFEETLEKFVFVSSLLPLDIFH